MMQEIMARNDDSYGRRKELIDETFLPQAIIHPECYQPLDIMP